MPKTFELSQPITINGKNGAEKIGNIEFRDPTAGEVRRLGQFVRVLRNGETMEIKVDTEVCAEWMATLSGRAKIELDQLALTDWQAIFDWMSESFNAAGN